MVKGWLLFVAIGLFHSVSLAAGAEKEVYNLTEGVTHISQNVFDLHMTILIICCVIGVLVFAVMGWSLVKHRKSVHDTPATFDENTRLEIIWTVIPFIILIGMAIPATKTLIAMEDTSKSDLTIKITGSQWKWHYEYLEHDIGFYSLLATSQKQIKNELPKGENYLLEVDRPLVIPANKKIRFLLTSDDVIHSWWVPAFAVKKDANPGFINEAWTKVEQPGLYRGQCAELCGKDHGFMPVVVDVKEQAEFDAWLKTTQLAQEKAKQEELEIAAMQMSQQELMEVGEKAYLAKCAACHQPNGQGIPGAFPAIKQSPIALGDINAHIDIVLHGKAGTAMQAFDKQLSLKELAAVITYQRNAWGNNTGDLVQAGRVKERMKGE